MTDKQRLTAPRDVSYDDCLTTSLTDPAEAAAYLDAVIEMEDTPACCWRCDKLPKRTAWPRWATQPYSAP